MARYGIRKLSLTDVADRAGISRATIYRVFRGKRELVRAVVDAEARRLQQEAADAVGPDTPLEVAIETWVGLTLEAFRNHAPLQRSLRDEPGEIADFIVERRGHPGLVERMAVVAAELLAARPDRDRLRLPLEAAAEWYARVLFSYALAPSSGIPDATVARLIAAGLLAD
jgi:AcrR family transcriptional regulator